MSDKIITMKKTVVISEEVNKLLKDLAKENGCTETKIFETAMWNYVKQEPAVKNDSQLIEELQSRLIKLSEQVYCILNMLNSLATNLPSDTYAAIDVEPHEWYEKSKKDYRKHFYDNP